MKAWQEGPRPKIPNTGSPGQGRPQLSSGTVPRATRNGRRSWQGSPPARRRGRQRAGMWPPWAPAQSEKRPPRRAEERPSKKVAQAGRRPAVSGPGQLAQYLLVGLARVQQVAQEMDAGLEEPPGSQVVGAADEKGRRSMGRPLDAHQRGPHACVGDCCGGAGALDKPAWAWPG